MLIIQDINLTWHKEERGGAAAKARAAFPPAYALPWPSGQELPNVALQRLEFFQHGEEFWDLPTEIRHDLATSLPKLGIEPPEVERSIAQRLWQARKNESQHFQSAAELNLTNLAFEYCGENLEVIFAYDERRSGRPARRGRNKDFNNRQSRLHGRDCLNETAFLLSPGEYGRVIWNERNVAHDYGVWYYQLHIYNLYYLARGMPSEDIFISREPDYEYQQLAKLY